MAQMLLDGQVFTHAVMGVVLGVGAVFAGRAAARRDPPHRWEGWIMSVLGGILVVFSVAALPSAYRFQKQFNGRVKEIRLRKEEDKAANQSSEATPKSAPQ